MADHQGLEGSQSSGIVPTLQNIVSTVDMDCKMDLKAIALQALNSEYNPKHFPALIMRISNPKTTALIFASGKMVCTGANSEQQSRLAARKQSLLTTDLREKGLLDGGEINFRSLIEWGEGFSSADLRAQDGARDPGCTNYRGTRGRRVPTPVPTPLPTRKLTPSPVLPARSPSIAAGKL